MRYNGQQIDSFTGDITASQSQATVSNSSVVWGDLHLRGAGSLGLRDWIAGPTSPIAANVQITNADLTKIMAIAGHPEIEVSGTVHTTAQIAGSVPSPSRTRTSASRKDLYTDSRSIRFPGDRSISTGTRRHSQVSLSPALNESISESGSSTPARSFQPGI